MSYSAYKQSRQQASNKFLDAVKNSGQKFKKDERYWQLTTDKQGNGKAILRFLPPPAGEDVPFVQLWSHAFKGPGGQWYIENSRTTLGENDPVSELNSQLWESGIEANKEKARVQKRKLYYIANVLVVKDPAKPENDGKVFLFKFGKKIFDKIKELAEPKFDDEKPIDVFDLLEGANFVLKAKKQQNFPNYDDSKFDNVSPLFNGDDDMLEKVYNSLHSLQAEVAPNKFKSYDELKKKLHRVLGLNVPAGTRPAVAQSQVAAPPSNPLSDEPDDQAVDLPAEETSDDEFDAALADALGDD
jgi:hypothetical protein